MFRATVLLLMLGCLPVGTARADAPAILPGSFLTIDAAVAKSDLVFEAKLTSTGTLDQENAAKHVGPIYVGAQVDGGTPLEKGHMLKGQPGAPMTLTIYLNDSQHETLPVVGQSYLFFVQGPRANGGYGVMKMLPMTKGNLQVTLHAVLKERAQKKLQQIQQSNAAQ
jgi:hypothetical protein